MSTESIQFALNERFAAPLPDFYRRRIIFWHDEDRAFEAMVDELELTNATLIKLTGTNNFAVKKRLVHDDPGGNYLVYDPFSYDQPQNDWLRDVALYSEEYRADLTSMQMDELNIAPKPMMRNAVKLYHKFLENKERRQKLKNLKHDYETPLQLHIDIMAVLTGLNGGTAQDVFIAVLSAGMEAESNAALLNIQKFGSIESFWQLARKYTGYQHEEEKPLSDFAAHVLLTALSQTMGSDGLKGLERFLSESNKAYCYGIVHEWRSREDNDKLWEWCRSVEQECKLPARFEKEDTEKLLGSDVFPVIHEIILGRFLGDAAEHVLKPEQMLRAAENRRTSGWHGRFVHYDDCLYCIAKMQQFYQAHAAGFHIVEPEAICKLYTEDAYEMDSLYRRFHNAFGCSLRDGNTALEDKLKHAVDYVEGLYQNWFLKELTACWTTAITEEMASLGYVSEVERQRGFYARYVSPLGAKGSARAFVIISDALRYEVAVELCETLLRNTKGTAKLEAMQAVFPSITKFGMAALLPGRELAVNDAMEALVDGMPTRSTAEREKVLCASNKKSVAVQHEDVLNMKRAARRELVSGKEVVYIYHNTIDAIGDKPTTEKKVFEACETAIQELNALVRIVTNDLNATDIFITADHGFLYTYNPLTEADKVGKDVFTGEVYEKGRRYALVEPSAKADYLMPVALEGVMAGVPVKGYTPQDATRIKTAGGGENYVHGGVSLQEMIVPVIAFKNLRPSSKSYVEVSNAELKLLSESRKVSNLLFALDFFQRQPVGDKVQPCTYTIYMVDEEGAVISDRQTVIADRTSAKDSDRVFRVRFHLKAGAYDPKKNYRLVIASGTDAPDETDFHLDIAFADDFGFDL